MANSILNNLTNQPSMNNPMLRLLQQMKSARNPEGMMKLLAQQNPQLNQIMQMANQSGKTYKDLFYEKAQQMGVNPDDILNTIK